MILEQLKGNLFRLELDFTYYTSLDFKWIMQLNVKKVSYNFLNLW